MVNLKAKPFYLSDEDIKWVNDTISSMTDEEKVGQLFFQLTAGVDEEYLKNLMEKYPKQTYMIILGFILGSVGEIMAGF